MRPTQSLSKSSKVFLFFKFSDEGPVMARLSSPHLQEYKLAPIDRVFKLHASRLGGQQ